MPPLHPNAEGEPYDAADPKQIEKAEKAAALREEQRRVVERALMGTQQGREWIWQLLSDCAFTETKIAVTGSAYEQGYHNGRRDVGISLMRRVARSAPAEFAALLKENDRG